jgi:hypothetical protein
MLTQILFHTERTVPGTLIQVALGIEEIATGDGTNNYVTYLADAAANAFVQYWSFEGRGLVRAEVPSNAFRDAEHQLSTEAVTYLLGLGWSPPGEPGFPNFHRESAIDGAEGFVAAAREGFRALEIYGYRVGTPFFETTHRELVETNEEKGEGAAWGDDELPWSSAPAPGIVDDRVPAEVLAGHRVGDEFVHGGSVFRLSADGLHRVIPAGNPAQRGIG